MFYVLCIILGLILLIRDEHKIDKKQRFLVVSTIEDFKECNNIISVIVVIFLIIFGLFSYPFVKLLEKLEERNDK